MWVISVLFTYAEKQRQKVENAPLKTSQLLDSILL